MNPLAKGNRTAWFAAVITILGTVQGLNWADLLPNDPTTIGWITTGIGIVIFALRAITSTPMFTKSGD